jgi:hypothetical protein
MKREPRLTPATMMAKMKPLPRRHRIAHLRALIRKESFHSILREELVALLRDEMTAQHELATAPPGDRRNQRFKFH